tara:strand:+ start:1957 stop:2106 length:150 start_codon:yes stop_codon:yes gene_type:complete
MDLTVNQIREWAPDLICGVKAEGKKNDVAVIIIPHGRIKIMPKHRKPGK